MILYQAYAFVLPGPRHRASSKAVVPFLIAIPFLFIAGVAVRLLRRHAGRRRLPPQLQRRTSSTSRFARRTTTASSSPPWLAIGLLFQVPIGILAVTRLGIVTPEQLAQNRRYAILVVAVAAMLLPGTDPVTMLISMGPLFLLFEGSLQLSKLIGRPPSEPYESELGVEPPPGDAASGTSA